MPKRTLTLAFILFAAILPTMSSRIIAAENTRLTNALSAPDQPPVHPDCTANDNPRKCTEIVNQIQAEFALMNQHFVTPNVNEVMKFFHRDVIQYVISTGSFYRGRDQLRDQFYAPIMSTVSTVEFDFSQLRYQVINQKTVVVYGAIGGIIHFNDGTTVVQNPLPQTMTWIRNDENDPNRPFVIIAAHE